LRHPEPAASINAATIGRDTRLPRTGRLDWEAWRARIDTGKAGRWILLLAASLAGQGPIDLDRALCGLGRADGCLVAAAVARAGGYSGVAAGRLDGVR